MGQITGEERGGLSEMGVFFLQCLQISPLVPLLHYEFHSAVLQAWHACTPFHPTKEPLTESPPPTFSTGEFWTACGILLGHVPKPGRLLDLANARPKHIRLQHLKYLQTRPMKEE